MFGLKLKKKKNKADKGLILANKGAQGEAFGGWGGPLPWGLQVSRVDPYLAEKGVHSPWE